MTFENMTQMIHHTKFGTRVPNDPKWHWAIQGHKGTLNTCYWYTHIYWVPCFGSLHSTTSRFRVTSHFETSAPNDSKNDIGHYKVTDVPYMCYLHREMKISVPFILRPILFELGPFSEKCSEWPQMTLNTTRSKISHVCVASLPESKQFSLLLSRMTTLSRVTGHLKKSALNDPKNTFKPQG